MTVDRLGEDTLDASDAAATRDAYLEMLKRFADLGIAHRTEVSLKLSALGQKLPKDAEKIALENAIAIAEAARDAGTTMTLDMEDHTTVDATLGALRDLRGDFPWVGVAIQAALFRTEGDIADLATAGSRIRLVKGAYMEPASVAHQDKHDVDKAYVRAMKTLMRSSAYPMIASHDQRMIDIAHALIAETGREKDQQEFQMLHGIRTAEQQQPGRRRRHDARVRALRRRLVRLLHAPPGRAPGQRHVLPELARQALRQPAADRANKRGPPAPPWTPSPTPPPRSTSRSAPTPRARPSASRCSAASPRSPPSATNCR